MESEVGTFAWAVKMIAEGKKVTRPCWVRDLYMTPIAGQMRGIAMMRDKDTRKEYQAGFTIDDFQATDWKLVE